MKTSKMFGFKYSKRRTPLFPVPDSWHVNIHVNVSGGPQEQISLIPAGGAGFKVASSWSPL